MNTLISLAVVIGGLLAFVAGDRLMVSDLPAGSRAWLRRYGWALGAIVFFAISLTAWILVGHTPTWRAGLNP
jgi:hypothetical protein